MNFEDMRLTLPEKKGITILQTKHRFQQGGLAEKERTKRNP